MGDFGHGPSFLLSQLFSSSAAVWMCRRKVKCGGEGEAEEAEEKAGKSSARDARPVPDPEPGLGLSGRL